MPDAEPAVLNDQEALAQITDDIWEHWISHEPSIQMAEGVRVTRLPIVRHEQEQEQAQFDRSILTRLGKIGAEALPYEDQLTLQVLQWDFARRVEQADYFWLRSPITPYSTPMNVANQAFTFYTFEQSSDLDEYLALLRRYPAMIDDIRARVLEQRSRGILLPKEELNLVVPFLSSLISDPAHSILNVSDSRLHGIKGERFREEITRTITDELNPRLTQLVEAVSGDYVSAAPDAVGIRQYPQGEAYYHALIKLHTTLALTPEEIHQTGLDSLTALDERMAKTRDALGFEGTKAEFKQYLKTAPRFFATTPDEVGERLMRFIRRIEPKMWDYFGAMPEAPYAVRRLEPHLEGAMTFGYYEVPRRSEPTGYYNYNGSKLDERSMYGAGSLVYHELIPGHHFQLAMQQENEHLSKVRRWSFHSAYLEGWAEYSADLAGEMGMYEDPYDQYGRMMMDVFLTTRLVVDTGMNYFGWSRERAAALMKENLLESDTQIYTESLRYSVDMPAQALAYKIGSLKMRALRQQVESALGAKFDIRRYHAAILDHGSMPLTVLQAHIDRFIEQERGKSS